MEVLKCDGADESGERQRKAKRGEYISELIKRSVSVEVDESAGILERIEQRLIRVEAQLQRLVREGERYGE